MVKNRIVFIFLIFFIVSAIFFVSLNSVSAANCWQYTANATCTGDAGCKWRNDSWSSSGWCEEKTCWSLYSQSDCATSVITGKNCSWNPGYTSYWCEKLNCWGLSGTSSNSCVNNSYGLGCQWSNGCYTSSGSSSGVNCWTIPNQSACLNATGCSWGQCSQKECSSYTAQATCNAAKNWDDKNCTWSNNYCTQNGCWNYYNETDCGNIVTTKGLNCQWKWGSCNTIDCYSLDFTNSSACVNNSYNFSCTWTGSYCNKKDCWTYNTQPTCQNQTNCNWKAYASSGWCQEVQCWNWDSTNSSACVNNSYGLSCLWQAGTGNVTGWCYKDTSTVSCSNKTTERACMDTMYCWWQYTDWNNVSAGGNCKTPGEFTLTTNSTIFNDWNPNCYIFDMNSTDCNNILGCNYTGAKCIELNNSYGRNITSYGLNCSFINNSELCNNIPVLSSCCSWMNSSCSQNKLSTSCWDQMKQKTEDSCEDSKTKSRCDELANYPWYMPCTWINSTSKCAFKASDVFGNSSYSIALIDNKKSCEAAGGKWLTENYCEGNVSVPTGRCEYKFDEEDNCDKACFACELKDSNGNNINSSNAQTSCKNSALGICEFKADTNAPNGVGYCKAKEQFKKGIAVDCDSNCGDCTFKGDIISNDTTKRPSYHCTTSKANSDGGGCKWVSDNSTSTGGYCLNKGEKTCEDSCDRCKTQTNCQGLGRTSVSNTTGSCKWQGESDTGSCVSNTGSNVEICWDGIDNTNDGLIDCADSYCYSDSYCGFVSGDCFGWTNNNTCLSNGCEWVVDKWGSSCNFKGSQCWSYNTNATFCNSNTNCQWNVGSGSGSGWCEQDWSKSEVCMSLNRTACLALTSSGCNWTIDSWCTGTGNSTEWCRNKGGWCEYEAYKPKNCWSYNSGSSDCNSHSGCSWKIDQYSTSHCEINWSANCWQYSANATCSAISNCWWKNDTWGSWCANRMDKCYNANTQSSCDALTESSIKICYWQTWGGSSGGSCQPLCYNSTITSSSCSSVPGCNWKQESGWCEEAGTATCSNSTNMNNQANCQATSNCRWKNPGWCDPKGGGFTTSTATTGGGIGTAMGADCYKYDGNQTLCTNRTLINISCGWMPETNPRCEVDWSRNCWQYNSSNVGLGCNSTNACWWNSGIAGSQGFCTNVMDQCWSNQTLLDEARTTPTLCASRTSNLCINNSWGGCEPACLSNKTQTTCTSGNLSGKCKWVAGWCNPSSMNQMFTGMESGMPAPLGFDACGTDNVAQSSVNICGFGMKDMGDSFGFGTNVHDFSNASVCNKEKISSFVMGSIGGIAGGSSASEKIGTGNDTVIFIIYLDTDGSTTGGCTPSNNASDTGYEFRFKYASEWNASLAKAVETFNSYQCDDSSWESADIKLSAWKKKMCSEISGPMIAVKKSDLTKFPTLYDSTKDMRVYVVSIGNTGNISSPSDFAGPGWATPGSIDFDIANAFAYGADTSKFEDILKKGFVEHEDCFNSIDDDGDNSTDCFDWDCKYSSKCASSGVNSAGYIDTKTPQVTGVNIEEYPDSALIMYDTNKPANGTLEFYYNDSICLSLNSTIYDVGILKSSTIRQYKSWHTANIYSSNLGYSLNNNTIYYYKLKVCDAPGKCAVSRCSNFTTSSLTKCGSCNFVARIKTSSDWIVSYDVNQDGTYEHTQGQVCGPNAGMKANYTIGRYVNIKLNKSDGSVYFEFINSSLTKTGLNDKVRTISSSGDIIGDTTKAGLTSTTRDKIINNLHPEICRIKIPFTGTCNELWHCDDSGNNCVNRTSSATLINSSTCLWQVPYCEFSTYKEASSSSGGTTSSGGGGSGSNEAVTTGATYNLTNAEFLEGYTRELIKNDQLKINIAGKFHYVNLIGLTAKTATISVSSALQIANLNIGNEKKFEVTDDNYYDLSVKLNSIDATATKASITVKSISEEIPAKIAEAPATTGKAVETSEETTKETKFSPWILVSVLVVIVIIAGIILLRKIPHRKKEGIMLVNQSILAILKEKIQGKDAKGK